MTVAVILKTLNEEARIGAAIESVLAALAGIGGEVIVADGGSKDGTLAVASTYPIRVVRLDEGVLPSCGLGPQLGFQYSTAPFICLMDGDMVLDPDFLPAALAHLDADPRLAGVTGHVVEMNVSNLEFARRVLRASPENRVGSIDRMNGGGVYRRASIVDVDYFSDRNLHGHEEFDLGLRLRCRGWTLHRLDRRFVSHFGHTMGAYRLLARRWRSGYLRGVGEVLRAAVGQPRWRLLWRDLPELKLWIAIYVWLAAIVAVPFAAPDLWVGVSLALSIALVAPVSMALRRRSIGLGFYSVVAWIAHAAALPFGFAKTRVDPAAWIPSHIVHDALSDSLLDQRGKPSPGRTWCSSDESRANRTA